MAKELKFAGSGVGEPWWIIGQITRRLLEPLGYEVEVLSESGSTNNPRYVGGGKADFGATVPQTLGWAVRDEHLFQGETFVPLRAVGRVRRPSWLTAAARRQLGFTSLKETGESDYPIRLVTHDLNTKLYDTNRRKFFGQAVQMAWGPASVTNGDPLPLHAGAERYYRELGLL